MKTLLFVPLLFIGNLLIAQDDYCPCMEEITSPWSGIAGMVSMLNGDVGNFIAEPSPNQQTYYEEPNFEQALTFVQAPQQQVSIPDTPSPKPIQVKSKEEPTASFVKTKKKVKRIHLKKSKRFKPYSGRCPRF